MTFSPDGRYLYTADNGMLWMTDTGQGGNTVSIIDTRTRSLVETIDLGKYRLPHGIDVDPKTGKLLVTTELPSMLLMIDPRARRIVKEYDIKGKAPHLVKLANDGVWAYTSNTDTGTVSAVNFETGEVQVIPIGERPQGMAFSPDNRRPLGGESEPATRSASSTRSRKRASARFQPARPRADQGSRPMARRWFISCKPVRPWGSPVSKPVRKSRR